MAVCAVCRQFHMSPRHISPGNLCPRIRLCVSFVSAWGAGGHWHTACWFSCGMSQLSSLLPSAPQTPVAFPPVQSAVPDATLPASNQVNATSFVEQLAKLLQTLTPQAEQVEVQAATVADQSATPATAASKPVEADAATPATAAAQPQVSAPETLVIATALHAPGAPSIRPRDTGSGKGKVEPARRASSISSQSGAPAVSLALSPDTAAAVQSAALATPNAEPRHNSALHRVGDQADSGVVAGAPSAASSPPWKPDELKPAVGEPQPSEAAPMHLTPINLDTNALPTTSAADSCQPATQPARSAEPQTAASSTGQQTSPAAQITPALMHLGHAPDGAQRLTMRTRSTRSRARAGQDRPTPGCPGSGRNHRREA